MTKKKWTKTPRIPPMADQTQVNFCKVPSCFNFSVVPDSNYQQKGRLKGAVREDKYIKVGGDPGSPGFICILCKKKFTIKSNLGINEEHRRLKAYLTPKLSPACKTLGCPHGSIPIKGNSSFYISYGESPSGYHKYQCKHCKKTLTVGTASRGHKKPHLNIEVFRCLIGKMPMRCIMDKLDITASTLYGKIDFLHHQVLAFVANRERRLLSGMEIPELQVSVDRQEYVVNWKNQFDKRNIRMMAIGSADNLSGYVFGMHLNFDSDLDRNAIETDARVLGEENIPKPFRKYARLWLRSDYEESAEAIKKQKSAKVNSGEVNDELDKQDETTRLPSAGMQIHVEYTMFGHFLLLNDLFRGVKKLTFYMDDEAGIQGVCNSTFETEVLQGKCQAFVVKIRKDLTVNERRRAIKDARKALGCLRSHYAPTGVRISDEDMAVMHLEEQIRELRSFYSTTHGRPVEWEDHWIGHPLPRMNEPEKMAIYITERPVELPPDKLANLFLGASLGGIDRFFMQVRRKLSLMERPIGTSSNMRRTWYGYSPYNPRIIQKLLDIYRVYYNYVKVGQDKQTPAMRLGLARSPIKMEDIIYYL